MYKAVLLVLLFRATEESDLISELDLPEEHIWYWVKRDEKFHNLCLENENCRLKYTVNNKHCWGYEPNCGGENSYSAKKVKCKQNVWGRSDLESQLQIFQKQGDFAKLAEVINTIKPLCISNHTVNSFLECSDHLRFCRARNIFFDFRNLNAKTSKRYRDDVIREGQIGGKCDVLFDEALLHRRTDEKSYLQSWAHELEHFASYPDFRISNQRCNVIFEKPTVLIKLDAAVSMYHHYCDFVNLYASQHVNGSFNTDIDILWWDTWSGGFVDPVFGATWRAFTVNKPHELIDLDGKVVCFRNVIFSLLARQRFGLYYNMPLLMEVLAEIPNVIAQRVDYNRSIPFLQQLEITHNSDIFIGMHGSGLTHLLFLPDWAAVFELYNCGDASCYLDLTRLRGIKYFTWTKSDKIFPVGGDNHPRTGEPHKKFQNYRFDRDEFRRLVLMQVEYVRHHSTYVTELREQRRKQYNEEL